MGKMESRCLKWTTLVSLLTYGFSEFTCPKTAEYGYSAQTTCVYAGPIDVTYLSPKDGSVGACIDGKCSNFNKPRYNVTFINANQSIFGIKNISIQDEGTWICTADQDYTCSLVITKTPTCHITSGNDTNNLDIHENISLLVNVTDYYCSTPIDFVLRAGNTEEDLLKNRTVKEKTITSGVFNCTFNVIESHIGSVELIFTCNDVRKTVKCGGVQTLKKRPPMMCKITADRDAGGLDVGDEITMSVYTENYFCSGDLELFLRAGGKTNALNVTGIYNGTITFTTTESHFGPVYLAMKCKNVSQTFTCDGIKELSKNCDDKIAVISGVVSFVAITIAVIILIWYFKYQRNKSSGRQPVTSQQDIEFEDIGGYTEVRDFNRNPDVHCQMKTKSKTNSQMTRDPGFAAAEEPEKEKEQTNCTGLSEQEPMPSPKDSDIYTKVNKATSGSSDNGGTA